MDEVEEKRGVGGGGMINGRISELESVESKLSKISFKEEALGKF